MPNSNTNSKILQDILDDLDEIIESSKSKDSNNSGNKSEISLEIKNNEEVVALLTGLGVLNSTNSGPSIKDVAN